MSIRVENPPLDLKKFDKVMSREYELQIDDDGEIHGLVAGDMGYDGTNVKLSDLVGNALYAVSDEGLETHEWPNSTELQHALRALIKIARRIIADKDA